VCSLSSPTLNSGLKNDRLLFYVSDVKGDLELLEWQSPKHRRKSPRFFVSGGVVGVIKTISSSKIVYHDADGEKRKKKMDRGMNLRPVTMDFQAGVGCIGFYAKYSPFGLFEKDKGPKVHPVSLGLQLHI
jgi:hypothetical protein